ncbi:hypothetical protein [Actinomadura litoris]|uniref:hypothetical protein n=1 Tax=Actinomadura litoris TaxID=2678616 RepID=UPI001FA712F2|nr:hypothetical protein [Actinomadura litoris]
MTAMASFPWSTLARDAGSVFPALDDSDVVLERRDGENLVLMRAERFEAARQALVIAARSLSILARRHRALAEEALAEELPWLVWLPVEERPQAVGELLDNLIAGVDTREFGPFLRALGAWRSTAIAWSDPNTARRLADPFDETGGEVVGRPGDEA